MPVRACLRRHAWQRWTDGREGTRKRPGTWQGECAGRALRPPGHRTADSGRSTCHPCSSGNAGHARKRMASAFRVGKMGGPGRRWATCGAPGLLVRCSLFSRSRGLVVRQARCLDQGHPGSQIGSKPQKSGGGLHGIHGRAGYTERFAQVSKGHGSGTEFRTEEVFARFCRLRNQRHLRCPTSVVSSAQLRLRPAICASRSDVAACRYSARKREDCYVIRRQGISVSMHGWSV